MSFPPIVHQIRVFPHSYTRLPPYIRVFPPPRSRTHSTDFFTNLYLFNGTFYFVTDDAEAAGFPAQGPGYIMSDVSGATKETAGPDRWQVITPAEAKQVLGRMAIRRHGVSVRLVAGSIWHFTAHTPF